MADPRPGFVLSKYYLDCVSDDGDVFIAYAAEVRWHALALSYTAVLVRRATEERKRVARGALSHAGREHEGWVIHEVVRWP
jgi:hypothetical protein